MNLNPFVEIQVQDGKGNFFPVQAQKLRHKFQDLYWHPSTVWKLYEEYTITELTTGLSVVRGPSLHHMIQTLNQLDPAFYFAGLQKARLKLIIKNRKKTK